jgi:hypothetical protein
MPRSLFGLNINKRWRCVAEIGGTAERIRIYQARVAASAKFIAKGQGILRDIQENSKQENKPTKDWKEHIILTTILLTA